jgi:hypothetical protein
MPPLSDLRSDSPLLFLSVGCLHFGCFERLSVAPRSTAMAIETFCCPNEVFGSRHPSSIHNLPSHTRNYFHRHRSAFFAGSRDVRRLGLTAISRLSLVPPDRRSSSAPPFTVGELDVHLNTVARLFATVQSSPRRITRESNDAGVCALSAVTCVVQVLCCARIGGYRTYHSLTSPNVPVSDRAGLRYTRNVAARNNTLRRVVQTLQTPWCIARTNSRSPQRTERNRSWIKVEGQ